MQKRISSLSFYIVLACLAYLGAFLLTYETQYLGAPEAVQYLAELIARLTETLVPLCGAAYLMPYLTAHGQGWLLSRTALISLPVLVQRLPEQYLFLLNGGLDSLEAVFFGFLFALGYAVLYFGIYLVLLEVMRVLLRSAEKKHATPACELRPQHPMQPHPWLFALGVFALPEAIVALVREVIGAVEFLSVYFHSFTLTEIVYIMLSVACVPLFTLLSLYVGMRLSMRLTAVKTETPPRHA